MIYCLSTTYEDLDGTGTSTSSDANVFFYSHLGFLRLLPLFRSTQGYWDFSRAMYVCALWMPVALAIQEIKTYFFFHVFILLGGAYWFAK